MLCFRPGAPKGTSNPKPFPASQYHSSQATCPQTLSWGAALSSPATASDAPELALLTSACTARPGPHAARASLGHMTTEAHKDPI